MALPITKYFKISRITKTKLNRQSYTEYNIFIRHSQTHSHAVSNIWLAETDVHSIRSKSCYLTAYPKPTRLSTVFIELSWEFQTRQAVKGEGSAVK